MGWTSSCNWTTKQDVIDEITSSPFLGARLNIVKKSLRGNNFWMLAEYNSGDRKGERFIVLFLLRKYGSEYGYKEIDESCGPCYYNCPLSFIKQAEEGPALVCPASETAKAWCEKVKLFHEQQKQQKALIKALEPGNVVTLYGKQYALLEPCSNHRGRSTGWIVKATENGGVYRMNSKQLNSITIQ